MNMLILIHEYMHEVNKALSLFEKEIGTRNIIRAWRDGLIERTGQINADIGYECHGIGCCILYDRYEVDFDFYGPEEVGFDAWRLWMYAEQFIDRFQDYHDLDIVTEELKTLYKKKIIIKAPSKHSKLFIIE